MSERFPRDSLFPAILLNSPCIIFALSRVIHVSLVSFKKSKTGLFVLIPIRPELYLNLEMVH